ncbi:hypothetical protein SLA2020_146720 [Shorea laevis]
MANKPDNNYYDFMYLDKRESSNSNGFQGLQRDNRIYNFMKEHKEEEQQRPEQPSIYILESSNNNNINNNGAPNINNNGARNVIHK